MNKDWWEQQTLHLLFKLPSLHKCRLSVCLDCAAFLGRTLLFMSGHALGSARVPGKPSRPQEQTSFFLHYAFLMIFNHYYFHKAEGQSLRSTSSLFWQRRATCKNRFLCAQKGQVSICTCLGIHTYAGPLEPTGCTLWWTMHSLVWLVMLS